MITVILSRLSMMKGMFVAVLLCFEVSTVLGLGTGAPTSACVSLTPNHTDISAQTSDSPYSLEIVGGVTNFTQGTPVTVKITGEQYGGFILQLRKKGATTPLGTWSAPPDGTKLLTCTTADSSMTHSSSTAKEVTLEYTWNPPASANGEYEFVATVAKAREEYWLGHKSSPLTANYGDLAEDDDNGGSNLGASAVILILVALMTSFLA